MKFLKYAEFQRATEEVNYMLRLRRLAWTDEKDGVARVVAM